MPEHEHGHGLQRERPPPALVGQHGVEEGRIRGVEHRPVAAVDAGNVPEVGGNLRVEGCPLCRLKWLQVTETQRQRRQR